ncbi:MFS transporter [Labedella populi]|uniref:MFS transporter n=1 Tax=Labedella populi TaxID=2498850 RepID=UPI001408B5E2|nr:MFS transporter [Labedella populi]
MVSQLVTERSAPPIHPRAWPIFALLVATAALTILDVSKVGVVLPAIQESTGGSETTIQLMLVGYTIAYAVLLLPAGRLGDILPRSTVFLVGASVFVLASALCALAPDAGWLVGGRIVQGAGAGILMPQVLGLIQRLFPPQARTKPLAILAGTTAVTSTFGPLLAGFVMEWVPGDDAWRVLFWINVALGAVILPFAIGILREPPSDRTRGFDLVGALLLVPAVILTIAPVSVISSTTPPHVWMLASVALGFASAGAFVSYERRLTGRGVQPLVDPALFRFRHLPAGVLISGFMHAAGTASTLMITLYLQQRAGQTPLETSLWMLPAALSMIVGSWVAGRFTAATSNRPVLIGTAVGVVGLTAISVTIGTVPVTVAPVVIAAVLLVSSFGTALVGPANQGRSLTAIPDYRSSVAGSLLQFSQRVGSAIGMGLALIVFYPLLTATTFAGRPTLGSMLAVGLTALFTLGALLTAVVDRERPQNRRRGGQRA